MTRNKTSKYKPDHYRCRDCGWVFREHWGYCLNCKGYNSLKFVKMGKTQWRMTWFWQLFKSRALHKWNFVFLGYDGTFYKSRVVRIIVKSFCVRFEEQMNSLGSGGDHDNYFAGYR